MSETLNPIEGENNSTAGECRDEAGRWIKGVSGNPLGSNVLTEEERLERKLKKEAQQKFIDDYINKLTEALPEITPVLIQKATEGDLTAIKEVNDRVMGKARQNIGLDGGDKDKPISITGITYIQPNGNSDNPNNKATPSVGGSEE